MMQTTLIQVYKALIQSKINYGSILRNNVNSVIRFKFHLNIPNTKQISGIHCNPARIELEVELGLLPISIRNKKLAITFLSKLTIN